jgi:hypothetical protein
MNSRATRQFRDLLASLPAHVRLQARDAYDYDKLLKQL